MSVKGKTNNPNGRPKGSRNKIVKDLRIAVKSFLEENWEDLKKSYSQLEPKDKLGFYEKLLQYSLPRLQSIDQRTVFESKLEELSEAQIEKLIDHILTENNEQG